MKYLTSRPLVSGVSARWNKRIAPALCGFFGLTMLSGAQLTAAAQDEPFGRLVEQPGLMSKSMAEDGRGRYAVVGGKEKFEFIRDGRKATIRFLCDAGSAGCSDAARKAQPLVAEPGGRGDMVFKSRDGITVVRVTATGGATLFGGASFVPSSVPKSGRAVVSAK